MHARRFLGARAAIAAVAALAVIAACSPGNQADHPPNNAIFGAKASGPNWRAPSQNAGPITLDPERSKGANSPPVPTKWPTSRIMGDGAALSTGPQLAVAENPTGQYSYQVFDASAGQTESSTPMWEANEITGPAELPLGTLTDGREYRWRSRPTGATDWSALHWLSAMPYSDHNAPRQDFGGAQVSLVTGMISTGLTSKKLAGPSADMSVTFDWRPDRPAANGLPAGWKLDLPGQASWTRLSTTGDPNSPTTVFLEGANAPSATYERNSSGLYVRSWAFGRPAGVNDNPILSKDPSSPTAWQLTDHTGTSSLFDNGYLTRVTKGTKTVGNFVFGSNGVEQIRDSDDPNGRSIRFTYSNGGKGCPSSGWAGFVSVPDKMLCKIALWDGTSIDVGYVEGGRIGLISQPGNSRTFGWSNTGKLVAIRSGAATDAAAYNSDLRTRKDINTAIEYLPDGRVATITQGAPMPGQARATRSFTYPDIDAQQSVKGDEVKASIRQGVIAGPNQIVKPAQTQLPTMDYLINARNWRPNGQSLGIAGTNSITWGSSGKIASVEDSNDAVTRFSYDPATGRRKEILGPRVGEAAQAPRSTEEYDTNPKGESLHGLQEWVFGNDRFSGIAQPGFFRPNAGLSEDYSRSPTGATEPWSARLAGYWDIPGAEKARDWQIEAAPGSGTSMFVYIDGNKCESPCNMPLKSGRHSIRVDYAITNKNGTGAIALKAGRPGQQLSVIPLDQLVPDYGLVTRTTINDSRGGRKDAETLYRFDKPWTASPNAISKSGPAGPLTTTFEFEGDDSLATTWNRTTKRTTPGGRDVTYAYWAQGATADAPCDGAIGNVDQSGQVKSMTRSDGVSVNFWYAAGGQNVATETRPSGSKNAERVCTTYDSAGDTLTVLRNDLEGKLVEHDIISHPNGNPQEAVTTTERGSGAKIGSKQTTTTTAKSDLFGRTISYKDGTGTTTVTEYDPLGNPIKRVIDLPGAKPVELAFQQDARYSKLQSVSLNGAELARATYRNTTRGNIRSVSYKATGTNSSWLYDGAEMPREQTTVIGSQKVVHATSRNPMGRLVSETVSATGPTTASIPTAYTYDGGGRLVSASNNKASGDLASIGGKPHNFAYSFGKQTNCDGNYDAGLDAIRTGGSRDGVAFETCTAASGRTLSSTDPLLTGKKDVKAGVKYDPLGRVTNIDANGAPVLTTTWSDSTELVEMKDGTGDTATTSSIEYANGRPVAKQIVDSKEKVLSNLRYVYGSPDSDSPIGFIDQQKSATLQLSLPGNAIAKISVKQGDSPANVVSIQHNDLRGSQLMVSAPGGKVVKAENGGALASRFGPFGEVLATVTPSPGTPEYSWNAQARGETLPGPSGNVSMGDRGYSPALGQFLASDPAIANSSNDYGLGEGDPLNRSDPSGDSDEFWAYMQMAINIVALIACIATANPLTGLAISVVASTASYSITHFAHNDGHTDYDALEAEAKNLGLEIALTAVTCGAARFRRGLKGVASKLDDEVIKAAKLMDKFDTPASKLARTPNVDVTARIAGSNVLTDITSSGGEGVKIIHAEKMALTLEEWKDWTKFLGNTNKHHKYKSARITVTENVDDLP